MNAIQKKEKIQLIVVFLAALGVFAGMASLAMTSHQDAFDQRVLTMRKEFVTPSLISCMKVITFLGDRKFLLPSYIMVTLVLLLQRRYHFAIMVPVAGIGAALLEGFFKDSFQRIRPDFPEIARLTGYSFPSGHALSSTVFFSMIIIIISLSCLYKGWKWALSVFFVSLVLLIGLSRVVLNVHYATDVMGGFAMGTMWAIVCYAVMRTIYYRRRKGTPPPIE